MYVFGLNEENMQNKVNSVDMSSFCKKNNIILDKSEDWENFHEYCNNNKIDKIITLGDSRIIPSKIVNAFDTIGNHGAILPDVQGGASLVWGRMLNNGVWGVSIMKIGERVDSGDILKIRHIYYHEKTTEEDFTTMADYATMQALIEVLQGKYEIIPNKKWQVRIARHTDSYKVNEILKICLHHRIPVYLPPRRPSDGKIKESWPEDYKEIFKMANEAPYPKWSE